MLDVAFLYPQRLQEIDAESQDASKDSSTAAQTEMSAPAPIATTQEIVINEFDEKAISARIAAMSTEDSDQLEHMEKLTMSAAEVERAKAETALTAKGISLTDVHVNRLQQIFAEKDGMFSRHAKTIKKKLAETATSPKTQKKSKAKETVNTEDVKKARQAALRELAPQFSFTQDGDHNSFYPLDDSYHFIVTPEVLAISRHFLTTFYQTPKYANLMYQAQQEKNRGQIAAMNNEIASIKSQVVTKMGLQRFEEIELIGKYLEYFAASPSILALARIDNDISRHEAYPVKLSEKATDSLRKFIIEHLSTLRGLSDKLRQTLTINEENQFPPEFDRLNCVEKLYFLESEFQKVKLPQDVKSKFEPFKANFIKNYLKNTNENAKELQDLLSRVKNQLRVASFAGASQGVSSCIAFIPIKHIGVKGQSDRFECLVALSGDETRNFRFNPHKVLADFISEYQPPNTKFPLRYLGQNAPTLHLLLQQISMGLSGVAAPLPANSDLLPGNAAKTCAEKRVLSEVCMLLEEEGDNLKILGSICWLLPTFATLDKKASKSVAQAHDAQEAEEREQKLSDAEAQLQKSQQSKVKVVAKPERDPSRTLRLSTLIDIDGTAQSKVIEANETPCCDACQANKTPTFSLMGWSLYRGRMKNAANDSLLSCGIESGMASATSVHEEPDAQARSVMACT